MQVHTLPNKMPIVRLPYMSEQEHLKELDVVTIYCFTNWKRYQFGVHD